MGFNPPNLLLRPPVFTSEHPPPEFLIMSYHRFFALLLLLALTTNVAHSEAVCSDGVFRATPAQTKGPFYFPSPIRRDVTEGSPGVPFTLTIIVLDRTCKPLPAGTLVELWSTDAHGLYSGYNSAGKRDESYGTFLRGGQLTNSNGSVTFDTVVPSYYAMRVPHLHFRVMYVTAQGGEEEFASQVYLSNEAYEDVAELYGRGLGTGMQEDVVIRGNNTELMTLTVLLTKKLDSGYNGVFTAAIDV